MEQKISILGGIKKDIVRRIEEAISKAKESKDFPDYLEPEIRLETPARNELGDFATGVAMSIARDLGTDGKQAAGIIVRHISLDDSWIQRVDIAGPGFINFFLHLGWL